MRLVKHLPNGAKIDLCHNQNKEYDVLFESCTFFGKSSKPTNSVHSFAVHPCDRRNKGGCNGTCEKTEGENQFVCKCSDEYELAEDGKSCIERESSLIMSYKQRYSCAVKIIIICDIIILSG